MLAHLAKNLQGSSFILLRGSLTGAQIYQHAKNSIPHYWYTVRVALVPFLAPLIRSVSISVPDKGVCTINFKPELSETWC